MSAALASGVERGSDRGGLGLGVGPASAVSRSTVVSVAGQRSVGFRRSGQCRRGWGDQALELDGEDGVQVDSGVAEQSDRLLDGAAILSVEPTQGVLAGGDQPPDGFGLVVGGDRFSAGPLGQGRLAAASRSRAASSLVR
jgi:hypothetical protein